MNEKNRQEAQAIIEEAKAKKGLVTVLTRRLEQYDDRVAKSAVAELRKDPNWRWLTRDSQSDRRKRRQIVKKSRKAQKKRKTFKIDEKAAGTITVVLSSQDTMARLFKEAHDGCLPQSLEELNAWLATREG